MRNPTGIARSAAPGEASATNPDEATSGPDVPLGFLYAFTAEEIMELRRLLLPNRMSRHDTPGEARLRQHVNAIREQRGNKVLSD